MPLSLFEALALLVVLVTLALSLAALSSAGARARYLGDYLLVALAGFVGEVLAMRAYRYYGYSPDWHARVLGMPVLVAAIWPLVIFSARSVREALFPAASPARRAAILFGLVLADATLMEVLATRAGLWSWEEPGLLDVPVLGILGWAYFAVAIDVLLDRLKGLSRLLVVPASVLVAHALIIASWWYGLRWAPRIDVSLPALVVLAVASLLACRAALGLRRFQRTLPRSVVSPRLAATLLFLALFLTTAAGDWRYWAVLLAIGLPYSIATDRAWVVGVAGGRPSSATRA